MDSEQQPVITNTPTPPVQPEFTPQPPVQNKPKKKKWLIALYIILGLGVLAGAAYGGYVYGSMQNKKENKSEVVNSNTQKPAKEGAVTPTSKVSTITLAAWGVTFTIPKSLADTKVFYSEEKSKDNPRSTYAFTTERIRALGGECAKKPFGDTMIVSRSTEKPIAIPDGEFVSESPIGGFYYMMSSPIAACSGFDSSAEPGSKPESSIEVQDRAALKTLLRSIEAN